MTDYRDYGFRDAAPAHTFAYLEPTLLDLLGNKYDRCILDLGCGNGYLVRKLIGSGYNAYGTDASEAGIEIASRSHPGRFFLQDLSSDVLPAALNALNFDTVISTEVIEHLYDPVGFLGFCRSVLPANGTLIISTPYHGYLKNLLLGLLGKWDRHMDPLWLGGHIKLWSRKTLSKALEDAGFRVTGFHGCGRVPFLWSSMIIEAKVK